MIPSLSHTKLAQLFEVEPGDTLEIQGDHNENWEVDVAGVVEIILVTQSI